MDSAQISIAGLFTRRVASLAAVGPSTIEPMQRRFKSRSWTGGILHRNTAAQPRFGGIAGCQAIFCAIG